MGFLCLTLVDIFFFCIKVSQMGLMRKVYVYLRSSPVLFHLTGTLLRSFIFHPRANRNKSQTEYIKISAKCFPRTQFKRHSKDAAIKFRQATVEALTSPGDI